MRTFIAFAAVVAMFVAVQALTDEQKAKVDKYGHECVESSGVEKEQVKKIKTGEFPEDPKLETFSTCFFQKTGFMDADGVFVPAVAIAKLTVDKEGDAKTKVEEAVNECKGGKTAYDIYKCYFNKTKTTFFQL